MQFYTAADEPRPVRLSEETRKWAWESLQGKYGDEAIKNWAVYLDDIPDFLDLPLIKRHDLAMRRIAEQAPLRVCPHERVSGAATLGFAISHCIPAIYNGKEVWGSTSHFTPNYRRTLHEGMESYAAQIAERLKDESLDETQRAFVESLATVVECMRLWRDRYLEIVPAETKSLLQQVPFRPARTFHEAVQSIWFQFSFMRLSGCWPGIGRIDWLLGEYLERDLAEGRITLDEAREILASLFIKGCEWVKTVKGWTSGDAQHYQNIILGGVDEEGKEVTNEVTYLVLDIVEELPIGDFPITVRLSPNSPEKLLRRMAEVIRHGGGVVAMYNEPLVMEALVRAGYDPVHARRFANDGCWEVQLPGETCFHYLAFDGLQILSDTLGLYADGPAPDYPDFESLYAAFLEKLDEKLRTLHRERGYDEYGPQGWSYRIPCTVVSLFTEGCIEKARSYYALGPHYTVRSPHIGGAADIGNSLLAIDRIVYNEKRMTLAEMVQALRNNWEGKENLRLHIRNKITYYGNDDDEADGYTARVLNDFAEHTVACGNEYVLFVPGVSTFGRQIQWTENRTATAFGAKKGEVLSGNNSATPGTDFAGATALIRSYCKADLARQTTGAALDVKLYPTTVRGEKGIDAIAALMKGFVQLGGFFMQLDVVDEAVLRAAQDDPKSYRTLSVRVSGWNARFVTLDKEWQDMVIERTAQHI